MYQSKIWENYYEIERLKKQNDILKYILENLIDAIIRDNSINSDTKGKIISLGRKINEM